MSVLGTISIRYSNMSATEKKIADIILANPQNVINYTVTDLAVAADVSRGSVINFAISMGYKGFNQLKIDLAKHSEEQPSPQLSYTQNLTNQIFQKVMDTTFSALRYTIDVMANDMRLTAEALVKADKILIFAAAPLCICCRRYRLQLYANWSACGFLFRTHCCSTSGLQFNKRQCFD